MRKTSFGSLAGIDYIHRADFDQSEPRRRTPRAHLTRVPVQRSKFPTIVWTNELQENSLSGRKECNRDVRRRLKCSQYRGVTTSSARKTCAKHCSAHRAM